MDKNNVFKLASSEDVDNFESFIDEADIQLDPVAGDRAVGELNDHEKKLYRNLLGIEVRLEEFNEEIMARINLNVAETLQKNGGHLDNDAINTLRTNKVDKASIEQFFYLDSLHRYAYSRFWFTVRKRVNSFSERLSIRSGYTVVSVGNKLDYA